MHLSNDIISAIYLLKIFKMQNLDKIKCVEGIRGVACLMVFLSHLSSTFAPSMHTGNASKAKSSYEMLIHNSPFAFFYSGVGAVAIFFVLSGFILAHVILTSKNPPASIAGMALKRYWRLMIPATASCLLAYIIFLLFKVDNSQLGEWAQRYHIEQPSILEALKNGSINAFFGGSTAYNWSLWTMKIELYGSVIVLFMCSVIPYITYKKSFVALMMLIPFAMHLPAREDIYYCSFISGVMIFLIKGNLKNALGIPLLIIGLFLCGYHYHGYWYKEINSFVTVTAQYKIDNYILFNSIGGFLFVLSIIKTKALSKLLSLRPLQYLGALSFSVYLIHQPFLYVVCPNVFNYFYGMKISYSISALYASFSCLLIVYLTAHYYHNYIDKFSISFSNSFKKILMKRNPDISTEHTEIKQG